MMLKSKAKQGSQLLLILFCFLIFMVCTKAVKAEGVLGASPKLYVGNTVVLTPGSSTNQEYKPKQADMLIRVITLGQGTIKVTLKKDDTSNDFISMYVLGYPTNPAFIPSFGVTPGEISVSTEIGDTLGGVGIVFILTTISTRKAFARELSFELN